MLSALSTSVEVTAVTEIALYYYNSFFQDQLTTLSKILGTRTSDSIDDLLKQLHQFFGKTHPHRL